MADRRTFLRGLAALPLIGGSVAILGKLTQAAVGGHHRPDAELSGLAALRAPHGGLRDGRLRRPVGQGHRGLHPHEQPRRRLSLQAAVHRPSPRWLARRPATLDPRGRGTERGGVPVEMNPRPHAMCHGGGCRTLAKVRHPPRVLSRRREIRADHSRTHLVLAGTDAGRRTRRVQRIALCKSDEACTPQAFPRRPLERWDGAGR